MPIYEYRCASCGHTLEALQKISDQPLQRCPACQQDALQKLVSAPSFRLKGGGWYETDFKKDKQKHLADSGNAPGNKAESASAAETPAKSKDVGGTADNKAAGGNTQTNPAK